MHIPAGVAAAERVRVSAGALTQIAEQVPAEAQVAGLVPLEALAEVPAQIGFAR